MTTKERIHCILAKEEAHDKAAELWPQIQKLLKKLCIARYAHSRAKSIYEDADRRLADEHIKIISERETRRRLKERYAKPKSCNPALMTKSMAESILAAIAAQKGVN